jgi:uncharacterized phage-associated protein
MAGQPFSAEDVARYFLALQDDAAGRDISNLKLQKLCYYAQGFSLAINGRPMFPEPIEAWQHGPVVPSLWRIYNQHRGAPIRRPADLDLRRYARNTRSLLDDVYKVFGQFSAWKLREMTHNEPPWQNTPQGAVISHEALTAYFKTQVS